LRFSSVYSQLSHSSLFVPHHIGIRAKFLISSSKSQDHNFSTKDNIKLKIAKICTWHCSSPLFVTVSFQPPTSSSFSAVDIFQFRHRRSPQSLPPWCRPDERMPAPRSPPWPDWELGRSALDRVEFSPTLGKWWGSNSFVLVGYVVGLFYFSLF